MKSSMIFPVSGVEQEAVTLDFCLECALNICFNGLKDVATIRKIKWPRTPEGA